MERFGFTIDQASGRIHNKSGWSNIGVNFDYQRSFKKKGEYLTFSYRYNGSPDNSEAYTEYEDIKNYPYDMS